MMPRAEFARAFCNLWTTTAVEVIPYAAWLEARDPNAALDGGIVLGVDAPPDRASGGDRRRQLAMVDTVVEVIDRRSGLAWVLDRASPN